MISIAFWHLVRLTLWTGVFLAVASAARLVFLAQGKILIRSEVNDLSVAICGCTLVIAACAAIIIRSTDNS